MDVDHFILRAQDTGDWKEKTITQEQILHLLTEKIKSVDFENVKEDVVRFIPDDSVLDIWKEQYFLDLIENLKFQEK